MTAVQPVPSPYSGMTLREVVRDQLAHSPVPNPHALVDHIYRVLDADQMEEAARHGLSQVVVEEVRASRNKAMAAPAPASTKWTSASRAAKARPDIFAQRVVVGSEAGKPIYKFLGACDRNDLTFAEQWHSKRGDEEHARAAQYAALRKKLRGAAVVNTLPKATVEGIFQ